MKAVIALEDGTCFSAEAFAGSGEVYGELVFNTSITGYQEILTDPSYHGQIVTMTYPLIGNYGVNKADEESHRPHAAGLVVGECSRIRSNWRAEQSLPDYLEAHGVLGLHRVDTRAVTLHIRSQGAMKCVASTEDLDRDALVAKAKASPGLVGRDLVSEVTTSQPYVWPRTGLGSKARFRVAVIDCGIKWNQLRIFEQLGCESHVFPCSTDPADILAIRPDGLFVSNGPGDPCGVAAEMIDNIRKLLETGVPSFGICFGHQMIGRALGGEIFKMKFGHRGANHPIQNLGDRTVDIASHNHGFCLRREGLDEGTVEVTHINLNDETVAGLRHRTLPVFSVQYHPEACPGPHDPMHLFQQFVDAMAGHKGRS
jgi:carbamoyl-phosphate synthase small subunit